MTDDLDDIVARYAAKELTLEEAVEVAEVDERTFKRTLRERDVEVRPYPLTRDTDEIIAHLAREMIVPVKTPEGYIDEYGLSKKGHDFVQARAGAPGDMPPPVDTSPPPAIRVIEKLGISSDEECKRVRERIENHPEWADNVRDQPPE